MSYQVIARKWRPKSFKELVGQTHISQTLINAIRNQRLPHALLFTGPRGTGKTSTARILAKILRCPQIVDFVPCNQCADCEDISAGRSVDVIEIDGASNNGVDSIRELRDSVGYMPSSGKHKIYIIDEVHMLSTSAFNALLKTLEEPPDHVVFILATTEVHKIPNTILSRCQRFDFRRIPLRQVAECLHNICVQENVEAEEQSLWMIARQGDGSLRDSQSLLDQIITFGQNKITMQTVVEVLGLTDRHLLADTLDALLQRQPRQLVDISAAIFKAGYDPQLFLQDLLEELRHLLMIRLVPENPESVVDLPQAEFQRLQALSAAVGEEDLHLLFDMALKGHQDLVRSPDPRVVLEMILLRMAAAPRVMDISRWAHAAPSAPTQGNAGSPTNSSASSKSSTSVSAKPGVPSPRNEDSLAAGTASAAAPVDSGAGSGPVAERWAGFVTKVKQMNALVAAKLEHTTLREISGSVLHVAVPAKMKFLLDQLTDQEFQNKLNTYIKTFWGREYQLDITLDSGEGREQSPKAMEQKQRADQEAQIRQQVENHPLIKTANTIFKTEIQSIRDQKG